MKTKLSFTMLIALLVLSNAIAQTSLRQQIMNDVKQLYAWNHREMPLAQRPVQTNTSKEALIRAEYATADGTYTDTYDYTYNQDGSINTKSHLTVSGWGNYGDKEIFTYDPTQYGVATEKVLQNWNGSAWENNTKESYTYYPSGELQQTVKQNWNGSAWENSERETYSYNSNGLTLEKLIESWNTSISNWQNDRKYTYTYDSNDRITEELFQYWDPGVNNWVNITRSLFSYSSTTTEKINQTWNSGSNQWINDTKTFETFDSSGNRLSEYTYVWDQATSQWIGDTGKDWTYNANNLVIEYIYSIYDSASSSFVPQSKTTYQYNANDDIQIVESFSYNAGNWDPSTLTEYYYDTYGYFTHFILQLYDSSSSAYVNYWQTIFSYNYAYSFSDLIWSFFYAWPFYHHKPLGFVDKMWDSSTSSWADYATATFNYQTMTLDMENTGLSHVTLYPNPASNFIQIAGMENYNEAVLYIFDMNGRLVKQADDLESTIDVSNLRTGIYNYKLQTPEGIKKGKLIVR